MKIPSSFTPEQRIFLQTLIDGIEDAKSLGSRDVRFPDVAVPRNPPETLTMTNLIISGSLFMYDSGSTTYQQIDSVSGALSFTDTGTAVEPEF